MGSFTQGGVVLNGQIIRSVLLSFWIGIAVVTIDLAFGLLFQSAEEIVALGGNRRQNASTAQ